MGRRVRTKEAECTEPRGKSKDDVCLDLPICQLCWRLGCEEDDVESFTKRSGWRSQAEASPNPARIDSGLK